MTTRLGLLGTYPPTQCGIATFTASLATALRLGSSVGDRVGVVQIVDRQGDVRPDVAFQLVRGDLTSRLRAVECLNRFDTVIIQHEYGIYAGRDGDELISLMDALVAPVIVVLHTILADPTPHQKEILEAVSAFASAVVVMSETARRRLVSGYQVDMAKVEVIAHGAPSGPGYSGPGQSARGLSAGVPTILTWGLIGPGKGIEWGIKALAGLGEIDPAPRYLVVGQTHPRVLEREGESYRESLVALAEAMGVSDRVELVTAYLDLPALQEVIVGADVVLLPYDSTEQISSGVLVEAVAAGKPVVATRFPHAAELLASGAGELVPHRSPNDMANALRRIITNPALSAAMSAEARRISLQARWPEIAMLYHRLAHSLIPSREKAMA